MEFLDSEMIILEVQQFPYLYDKSDVDFNNHKVKRDAWMIIAKNLMGEKWDQLDEEARNNIGKEVQKRWRSMKDSFLKSLRSEMGESRDASKQRRPYIYHKQMAFLQGHYRQSGSFKNIMDVDRENTNPEDETREAKMEDIVDQSYSQMPKKQKCDSFEAEIIKILKANIEQQPAIVQDPDEMFLLSQMPNIKKMTPSDKLQFQIKFLELIQTYTNPNN